MRPPPNKPPKEFVEHFIGIRTLRGRIERPKRRPVALNRRNIADGEKHQRTIAHPCLLVIVHRKKRPNAEMRRPQPRPPMNVVTVALFVHVKRPHAEHTVIDILRPLTLTQHDRVKAPPPVAGTSVRHPPKTPRFPRALPRVSVTFKKRPRATQQPRAIRRPAPPEKRRDQPVSLLRVGVDPFHDRPQHPRRSPMVLRMKRLIVPKRPQNKPRIEIRFLLCPIERPQRPTRLARIMLQRKERPENVIPPHGSRSARAVAQPQRKQPPPEVLRQEKARQPSPNREKPPIIFPFVAPMRPNRGNRQRIIPGTLPRHIHPIPKGQHDSVVIPLTAPRKMGQRPHHLHVPVSMVQHGAFPREERTHRHAGDRPVTAPPLQKRPQAKPK